MALDRPGPGVPEDVRGRHLRTSGRGGPRFSMLGEDGGATSRLPRPSDVVVSPPREIRPPSGKDFNLFGVEAAASAASTPAVITGSVYDVPDGSVGVIRSIVLTVNQLLATSDIEWSLRFDQTPVEGWDALSIFPSNVAVAQFVWTPDETVVDVPEGSRIDVQVEVFDGGTYQLGAAYHGWHYATELADRYAGAYR